MFLLGTQRALAAAGDPDPSFGSNGVVRVGFGGGDDFGRAAAVQADGKLLVAGYSGLYPRNAFTLVRYNTNDTLDASFGEGGKVFTQTAPLTNAQAAAMRIQADGKIIVAGFADAAGTFHDFAVARYNPDGSLDSTFNGNGMVTADLDGYDEAFDALIQPDGKILVAGGARSSSFAAVLRYDTNGTPDLSWNGTGSLVTSFIRPAAALLYLSDGKIVVVGTVNGHIGLARFNSNGTLDTTFGAGGRTNVVVGSSSGANAVAIQFGGPFVGDPDKILVAGQATVGGVSQFALARFNLDGSPDTSFGAGGVATTALGAQHATAQGLLVTGVRQSRRITLAGYTYGAGEGRIALMRYTLAGAPDSGFGASGAVLTGVNPGGDEAHGITLYGGKVLVAGFSKVAENNHDFAMVRYNGDGALDTNYNGSGVKLEDVADLESAAQAVAIQPDGKVVLAGFANQGNRQAYALARLNPDGSLDPAFGAGGKVKAIVGTNTSGGNALALQPDGKILVAGHCAEGAALARFQPDGALDPTFDGDGELTATNGFLNGVTVQPDGKIVAAGYTDNGVNNDFLVMRLLTNGAPDASFDTDGRVSTALATGQDSAYQVKVQPDGKIVAAGGAEVNANFDFALVRYQTNGALDNTFGSFGRAATDFPIARTDVALGMAMQPDGRIVLAGYSANPANNDIDVALARYLTNGVLDATFDGDGRALTAVGFATDLGSSVALQPDGKILAGGLATIGADYMFAALRYKSDGSLDGSYGAGGKAVIDVGNGNDLPAAFVQLALDAQGRAVLAGQIRGRFGVVRLLGDPELRIASITRFADGRVLLRGTARPNAGLTIHTAGAPAQAFTVAGQTTADGSGGWAFEHAGASGDRRFYRASDP